MIVITEECHPEEMQAFAARRPAGWLTSRGLSRRGQGTSAKAFSRYHPLIGKSLLPMFAVFRPF
jgi:hypothetical protein